MMVANVDANTYADIADMRTGSDAVVVGMDADSCVGIANMRTGADANPGTGSADAQQGHGDDRSEQDFHFKLQTNADHRAYAAERQPFGATRAWAGNGKKPQPLALGWKRAGPHFRSILQPPPA